MVSPAIAAEVTVSECTAGRTGRWAGSLLHSSRVIGAPTPRHNWSITASTSVLHTWSSPSPSAPPPAASTSGACGSVANRRAALEPGRERRSPTGWQVGRRPIATRFRPWTPRPAVTVPVERELEQAGGRSGDGLSHGSGVYRVRDIPEPDDGIIARGRHQRAIGAEHHGHQPLSNPPTSESCRGSQDRTRRTGRHPVVAHRGHWFAGIPGQPLDRPLRAGRLRSQLRVLGIVKVPDPQQRVVPCSSSLPPSRGAERRPVADDSRALTLGVRIFTGRPGVERS